MNIKNVTFIIFTFLYPIIAQGMEDNNSTTIKTIELSVNSTQYYKGDQIAHQYKQRFAEVKNRSKAINS